MAWGRVASAREVARWHQPSIVHTHCKMSETLTNANARPHAQYSLMIQPVIVVCIGAHPAQPRVPTLHLVTSCFQCLYLSEIVPILRLRNTSFASSDSSISYPVPALPFFLYRAKVIILAARKLLSDCICQLSFSRVNAAEVRTKRLRSYLLGTLSVGGRCITLGVEITRRTNNQDIDIWLRSSCVRDRFFTRMIMTSMPPHRCSITRSSFPRKTLWSSECVGCSCWPAANFPEKKVVAKA